jgi:hypothetical protein
MAVSGRFMPWSTGNPSTAPKVPATFRFSLNGKRIWQPVGTDASQAVQAEALGMAIPEAPTPSAAPDSVVDRSPGKIDLPHAIAEYLVDTAVGKSKRTSFAYSYTLKSSPRSATSRPWSRSNAGTS